VSTLGIPLLRVRAFTEADNETAPPVGMINAKVARDFFADTDPIGKRFMFGHAPVDPPKWITIVGVLADTKLYGLANPARLEVYRPLRQAPASHMTLVVKSSVDRAGLLAEIRAAVASIDKDEPIFAISTMNELLQKDVSTSSMTLRLLGLFSILALLLAAIGIYGVISYSVTQRTREIGIRMAFGAQQTNVLRTILHQGSRMALAGVGIGILAALALTRLMSGLLFSVSPSDPGTFGAVAMLLVGVAMLASYIPARRAVRVDPIVALRHE
jgi:putative ABC transport system permease protein